VIEGLLGLTAMMVLCCLRVPISFAMAIVGFVGYAYMRDWNWVVAAATVQTKMYETGRNYTLSVVPLFILMGNFVTRAGMSQELFRAAYTFIGHLRGCLAMATVWASAGFGGEHVHGVGLEGAVGDFGAHLGRVLLLVRCGRGRRVGRIIRPDAT
jgi:TRAP-type mannitol/chloroaromatic compound transport system permease large subunit